MAACFALAALAAAVPAAWAQRSGLTITPTFKATQEFTDNLYLSATNPRAEAITTLTPGLRISSWSGPLQGSLDFGLSGTLYARDSSASGLQLDNQNELTAAFEYEVVEQHVFIDAQASIGQQSVSAFGLQANRPSSINSNSTEYRSLTVSPSVRGKLFDGEVGVVGRLTSRYSDSSGGNADSSISHNASVSLNGGGGAVVWSVVVSQSFTDYEDGRATSGARIFPQISYTAYPGLRFFVSGGYELNDVLSLDETVYKNWGGGFAWQPTPRTQVSVQTQRRFFGSSWNVTVSHRMRRAVVVYSDSNSADNVTTGAGAPLTTYDLFFAQFASIEPDPALRDVLVRNFLQAAGLDPKQVQSGGFISRAVTASRGQNLSLALRGRRNSLVLSAFATSSRRLDTLSTAVDDLSQVSRLNQQGVSVSLSHRLTPTASAALSASARRTPSRDGIQGNDFRNLSLSWSDRIGSRSSVSVQGRHAQATGANPYKENSVLGTFNYSF